MRVVKRESVFIPIKEITKKQIGWLEDKLTFHFYAKDGKACEECENLHERPNDICQQCSVYGGGVKLCSKVVVGKNKYMKIPVGSSGEFLPKFKDVQLDDRSPSRKIARVKFTGTLKPEQLPAVAALIAGKRGILDAPPRSGKTVTATAMICELRRKTLILASQRDWLMGFHETFVGSDTQKPLTDLDKSRIKLCKKFSDFEDTDICLATVQTFHSEKGQKLLKKLRDMFEVIVVDEVHTSAADKYITVLARLNTRWAIGLSGTPDRKDNKFVLTENVLGPVIYKIKVAGVRPRIELVKTAYSKSYGQGHVPWSRVVSSLENDKKRLKLIAKYAVQDVMSGHMVLIPMAGVKPVQKLIKLINDLAKKRVAFPFMGGMKKVDRDSTIQDARAYKKKILVGTMKVLSTGINIPRASCLYEVALSSNIPNAQQRMKRILTPMEGKPQPVIRFFLDNMGIRRNCMRTEWFQVVLPIIKPVLDEATKARMHGYFNERENPMVRFEL